MLVSSPRFVGRRKELGVLEDALARAEHGEGSIVLVSGESGMGKSRLIGGLVATARDRGEIVMVGECVEFAEGELPYVVIAARVAALALGGEILVTSLIRELAEGATGLHFGARREHSFKGLSGTHSVFPLHWDPES